MLLDQYEEGIDSSRIDVLFEDVKNGVLPLLERIRKAPHPDVSLIRSGCYDKNDQMKVQDFLLDYIGFDFECGAAAESEHPFTSGLALHDVRVTNHYRPANDSEGILQDMHGSDGSFGYFPSYLLGSAYDGMYLQVIERELGSIDSILAEGRIKDITGWLQTHIHQHGSMYLSSEVMERISAGEISAKPLIDYFNRKYSLLFP